MSLAMSYSMFILLIASWVGYFWLGLQIGKGQSEYRRKHELEDLERRFRVVDSEAGEVADVKYGAELFRR
jgi:hypothetical protein